MLTSNKRIAELRQQIREQFCTTIELHDFGEDTWAVSTPFIYGDGDGLPVMIEHANGSWTLTDNGGAVDRWALDYPGYPESDENLTRARRLVESYGAMFARRAITLRLPRGRMPNGFDIAYFLRIVAAIDVLPRPTREPRRRFRQAIRETIDRLVMPDAVESNYVAPRDTNELWPVEYRIETGEGVLLAWAIGGRGRAADVTSAILVHRSTFETPGEPTVILRRSHGLGSTSRARIEDIVDPEHLIEAEPGVDSTLLGAFNRLGVPLVSA